VADMMEWLRAGVPLTLVLDLLDPSGPGSRQIYAEEPADTAWLARLSAGAA
jgi:hypothetical protein